MGDLRDEYHGRAQPTNVFVTARTANVRRPRVALLLICRQSFPHLIMEGSLIIPGTSLRTRPRSHPDETELRRLFFRRLRTAHFSADRRTEVCQLVWPSDHSLCVSSILAILVRGLKVRQSSSASIASGYYDRHTRAPNIFILRAIRRTMPYSCRRAASGSIRDARLAGA